MKKRPQTEKKPALELFDLQLQADPGEATNVIAAHPKVVADLQAKLTSIVTRGRTTPGAAQSNDSLPNPALDLTV